MNSPDAILQVDGHDPAILILALNRPAKRNALSISLITALRVAVQEASQDRLRRVIILRGLGPVFCAGLDLSEASDVASAGQSAQLLAEMYESICLSPQVVIGAAQGAAMGGGAGILAACDLVVASDDLRLGYPEVKRGLVAALVTCLLRRQVSDRAARELVLRGRPIQSADALRLGLVSEVVPLPELMPAAEALAREICGGAPGAIARTKRLLDNVAPRPIAEELRRALAYHLEARNSAEAAEGIAAFREKRAPRWGAREV